MLIRVRKTYMLGVAILAALLMVDSFNDAKAACGDRNGPGYRGPNGKCVGWAEIGRVCGNPPTLRCAAERAHPDAAKAAGLGQKIETLRPINPVTKK